MQCPASLGHKEAKLKNDPAPCGNPAWGLFLCNIFRKNAFKFAKEKQAFFSISHLIISNDMLQY